MTNPVIPTPITSYPPAPQPTDTPAVFDQRAAAFVAAQVVSVPQFNKAATDTYQNAMAGAERAFEAAQSATDAAVSANVATGAANFKGEWSTLTGPLNKPATVKHNGRFWLLLQNVPDVTAAVPGVSPAWTSSDVGTQTVVLTADATALPGTFYVATTPGITVTIPGGWLRGDTVGGRNISGGVCYIAWGANTLLADAPENPMAWPPEGRFETTYSGSTFA